MGEIAQKVVMVVDDNEILLGALEMELLSFFDVKAFANSKEAAKYITDNYSKIDIVVSDYLMPDMNGLQLLKHTKDTNPAIKRILLTAYIIDGTEKEQKALCDTILDKGILQNVDDLIKAIRK